MVTGYDHLLFLAGVIFFLYRARDIGLYVSLFALGHSTTMLLAVYYGIGINAFLIDAVIGLSVVYKALATWAPIKGGLAFSPTPKLPPWCLGCSTASASQQKFRNLTSPATG